MNAAVLDVSVQHILTQRAEKKMYVKKAHRRKCSRMYFLANALAAYKK